MIEAYRSTQKIQDFSDNDLLDLANKIHKQGVAVFYDQKLEMGDLVDICKRFGECETPNLFMNPTEHPEISLVTGKRKDDGQKIGMFGDTDIGWHSNGNSRQLIDKI